MAGIKHGMLGRLRPVAWKVVVFGFTVLATACTANTGSSTYLPPSPPVVQIAMHDYRFEHEPVLPSGRVIVRAPNEGSVPHEMVVTVESEDAPPIDEQLRDETPTAALTFTIVAPTPPGETGTLAVDLAPGRYAVICFIEDADGVQHFTKGMSSEFRVQ